MSDRYVSDAMREAIGRQLARRVSFPVSESDIRRWAIAVYYPDEPPQWFWNADAARKSQYSGIVAPQEFNPFAWMVAERSHSPSVAGHDASDRTELLLGIDGPGLKFQLNGGIDTEYGVAMRPGDVITSVTRLAGYYERQGRLGLMLFTVSEDVWTNQAGELVKRTRHTLIRY